MHYFLVRYLYKKNNSKDYLALYRIEELFSGINEMICYLVENLALKNKKMEAIGIMQRNKVESYISKDIY